MTPLSNDLKSDIVEGRAEFPLAALHVRPDARLCGVRGKVDHMTYVLAVYV
jgi:hypothetical protein